MRGLQERGVLVRGRRRARQRRVRAARHLRAAGGERALPRRARRGARARRRPLSCLSLLDGAPPVCYKLTQAVMSALAPTFTSAAPAFAAWPSSLAYLAWRFI